MSGKPLAIDLFAGLGGWSDGLLAEGYDVIGFDIERHHYGEHYYPAQLVLQDVMTIHGKQFKDAALIVASPPCQEYSYMAMPWSLAKEKRRKLLEDAGDRKRLTMLFDACFRIQREACEAAGRHIPLIVENVKGAQPWVGRARGHYGSFYLWGDVPALLPMTRGREVMKYGITNRPGQTNFHGYKLPGNNGPRLWKDREVQRLCDAGKYDAVKVSGMNWSNYGKEGYKAQGFNMEAMKRIADGTKGIPHKPVGHWTNPAENGTKIGGDWFSELKSPRRHGSNSNKRKAASAMIAKIPFALSSYIARVFKP